MKLKKICTFPYNNYLSKLIFDENGNCYFAFADEVINHEIVKSKIMKIDVDFNVKPFAVIDGVVNCKTLRAIGGCFAFSVCDNKVHKLCVYDSNGTFEWEKVFDSAIVDVNSMPNGNFVTTTYAGDAKSLVWTNNKGNVLNSYSDNIRFANFIISNDCVFVSTDKNLLICDFDGNVKKCVDIGHTTFSLLENRNNPNNENSYIVVTSKDAILSIDSKGNIINKYSLNTDRLKFFDGINNYGLNSFSDEKCFAVQNGWLSSKLIKLDMLKNTVDAECCSKDRFLNTPFVTKDESVVAVMQSVRGSYFCVIFDSMLNEIEKTKLRGEVFDYSLNNNVIYVMSLNKKANEIDIYSF